MHLPSAASPLQSLTTALAAVQEPRFTAIMTAADWAAHRAHIERVAGLMADWAKATAVLVDSHGHERINPDSIRATAFEGVTDEITYACTESEGVCRGNADTRRPAWGHWPARAGE